MRELHVLESPAGEGDLFFRQRDGCFVACVFTSERLARDYILGRSKVQEWRIACLNRKEAHLWLELWKRSGLRELVVNPTAGSDGAGQHSVSVDEFNLMFWSYAS
jgi:hypothetical protein